MCNVLVGLQWLINSLIVCNDNSMNRSVIKVWIEMWIEMRIEVRVFVMNTMWWMMKRGVKMWMKRVMWCRDTGDVEDAHEIRWWLMKRVWWRERNEERSEDAKELWGGGGGRLVGVTLQRDRILPQIRSPLQWYFSVLNDPYNEILAYWMIIIIIF